MLQEVNVRVPATTANMGAGFVVIIANMFMYFRGGYFST